LSDGRRRRRFPVAKATTGLVAGEKDIVVLHVEVAIFTPFNPIMEKQ
jgi:hypothetical protein